MALEEPNEAENVEIALIKEQMAKTHELASGMQHLIREMQDQLTVIWEQVFGMQEQINGIQGSISGLGVKTEAEPLNMPRKVLPGDIVTFGDYNGRTLDWRVLSVRGRLALLISDRCIGKRPFHEEGEKSAWVSSPLRQWLNTEFITHLEGVIEPAKIKNKAQKVKGYEPFEDEPDTEDLVFLLSLDEVEEYFEDDASRVGVYRGQPEWWWLRTPGVLENTQAFVHVDGKPVYLGALASEPMCCVRPALWVDLGAIGL
ncbi:MAG: DUF6273 domain-containing protein [Clostridiales bacterium]|jgi:hypothetical protein|nr:DUF6273 domain-containing protein [Clostridiales bacterium]